MNRYGKILNGSKSVKVSVRDVGLTYSQICADSCPEGYKPVERVLPYPSQTEGNEVAFVVTDCGDHLTKEGFLVPKGTSFAPRKFSKLSIYAAITKLGAWSQIQSWLESKTVDGFNGWVAFQLAQEINDSHPLFAPLAAEAKGLLGLTDEQFEAMLNACILKD